MRGAWLETATEREELGYTGTSSVGATIDCNLLLELAGREDVQLEDRLPGRKTEDGRQNCAANHRSSGQQQA